MVEIDKTYLSETLFHFWPHEPQSRAFNIFKSIVKRGLLLSRGNGHLIDSFYYYDSNNKKQFVSIVQQARVCFTDIPEDKLDKHCCENKYGKFGIGFKRKTILEWGGKPVWYLPNHAEENSVQESSAILLKGFADLLKIIDQLPQLCESTNASFVINGQRLSPNQLKDWMQYNVRGSIVHLLDSIKEMSSKDIDDHKYLYEREWRIIRGIISSQYGDICRQLNNEEKTELTGMNSNWGLPMNSEGTQLNDRDLSRAIIDSFYFFNGLPNSETVSQKIEKILVSNDATYEQVLNYIKNYPEKFKTGGPIVQILES